MKANQKKWLLYGGIGLAVVILAFVFRGVVNSILVALGLKKSAVDKKQEKSWEQVKTEYFKSIPSGQRPTKTDAEWLFIANTIYEDLRYSSVSDNKEDAGLQLCRVKNNADVAKLIQMYGERVDYWFAIPLSRKDLPQMVRSELSNSKIEAINDNYRRKNISFRY